MSIELPRSVVLSLWLERIQREGVGVLPGALAAIQTEDEPHRVHGSPDLGLTLSDLAAQATFCHAVLPVPGELQAPAEAGQVALEAGEALLVRTGAGTTAFVPQVHQFGSPWEPGSQVMWQIISSSAVVPLPSSMSHARQELAHGLEVAIDTLTRIDVAKWREEDAEEIAQLASCDVPPKIAAVLPPAVPPRQQDLLVRSARLLAIVELAVADDGAAVNLWQADQRATAMRHVATTARRAMVAASAWAPQASTSR